MFNFQDFIIQQGIQAVLGLLAVALTNPNSKTFQRFVGPLTQLRDTLNLVLPPRTGVISDTSTPGGKLS